MPNVTNHSSQYNPPTAQEILRHVGIVLPHYRTGITRMPCPRCSPGRKVFHRHLKCLTVEIRSDDSVIWCCHHPGCSFAGPRPEHVKGLGNGRPPLERRPATHEGNSRGSGGWIPMVPPPADHREFMRPRNLTALYRYYDRNGALLFYVSRRDLANGGKDILPHTYGILDGRMGWYVKRMNPPLPLYGLRLLALAPDDFDVFIVEGEKAADALNVKLRNENYAAIAMSWPGGTDNVGYCDWKPLRDRSVILWPDADDPGLKAINQIEQLMSIHGATVTARIFVSGLPQGFDAADLTTPLEQFLKERCR